MAHIKRFKELFEAVGVPKDVRKEKLPHCADMESKGYRIAQIGASKYAFSKNYVPDDEIYWLGQDTIDYKYGQRYIATPEVTLDKEHNPFYILYCKCDPSPTDAQKKVIAEREKEIKKNQEEIQKHIRGERNKRKRKG